MPVHSPEPIKPTPTEIAQARQSHGSLSSLLQRKPQFLVLRDPQSTVEIQVPQAVVRMLVETLKQMAQGHAVTLIPIHSEVTTQQAADLLNVSRPFLVKLLDEGRIPHKKVGRHRRIRLEDLMAFKHRDDLEREAAFDEMVALSQELGLGYE
jgi:excisionase family DNA binding protein